MRIALVVAASMAGAGWGVLVPRIVHRYAVAWPAGAPRPRWRPWCRTGGARSGPPVVLTVALAAAGCGVVTAALGPRSDLPAFLVLVGLALPLGFVDVAVQRLPDPLVLAALVSGGALLTVAGHPERLARAAAGALACGAGYAVLALLPGSPLGYGDVKLGAVLGLYLGWLGWPALVAALVGVPLLATPHAVYRLVTAGRRATLPYGPAMLVSTLGVAVLTAR